MKVHVIKENCPQNHSCPVVRMCPFQAVQQTGFSAPTIDAEKCLQCGRCTYFCPTGAIQQK